MSSISIFYVFFAGLAGLGGLGVVLGRSFRWALLSLGVAGLGVAGLLACAGAYWPAVAVFLSAVLLTLVFTGQFFFPLAVGRPRGALFVLPLVLLLFLAIASVLSTSVLHETTKGARLLLIDFEWTSVLLPLVACVVFVASLLVHFVEDESSTRDQEGGAS